MFSWCIYLFSVLVFVWIARSAPASRTERRAFLAVGAVLLVLALVALLGFVGASVTVQRHG